MNPILEQLCKTKALNPLESHIIELLGQKKWKPFEISQEINVSEFQTEILLKDLSKKMGTDSLAGLVKMTLLQIARVKKNCSFMKESPRVLLLDDIGGANQIVLKLEERGISVTQDPLSITKCNLTIVNARSADDNSFKTVKQLKAQNRYFPLIALCPAKSLQNCKDLLGSPAETTYLEKPLGSDSLFLAIFDKYLSQLNDHSRQIRFDDKIPVLLNGKFRVTVDNIGPGGVFIPFSNCYPPVEDGSFEVGDPISFDFKPVDIEFTIHSRGEVVWKRESHKNKALSGIGVKFNKMDDSDKKNLEDYLNLRKLDSLTGGSLLGS